MVVRGEGHKRLGRLKRDGVSSEKAKEPMNRELFARPKTSVHRKRVLHAASLADILGSQSTPSVSKDVGSVPEKWKPFYRKLLRLQTLLTDRTIAPEDGDEELLEFATDRPGTLVEVKAAIDRIFKGTYGVCELTRKPIEPERLAAIPYTRYSLEGQWQMEALRSDVFVSKTCGEERDEAEPPYSTDDEADA